MPDRGLSPAVTALRVTHSMNLHRRHLSASQLGMVGARMATRPHGDQSDIGKPISTQPEIAEALGVSRDTISQGKKVLDHGTLDEIAAVRDMAVSTAANA